MRKAGLIGLSFILAGCLGQNGIRPLRPLEIPTAPYLEETPAALTGSLMYEGGCLLFRDDESGKILLPVWPVGSTFNGTAVQFHKPGKSDQRLFVPEEFVMEGRPLEWAALTDASYQPMQQQCGSYAPFFVANVRPAN